MVMKETENLGSSTKHMRIIIEVYVNS